MTTTIAFGSSVVLSGINTEFNGYDVFGVLDFEAGTLLGVSIEAGGGVVVDGAEDDAGLTDTLVDSAGQLIVLGSYGEAVSLLDAPPITISNGGVAVVAQGGLFQGFIVSAGGTAGVVYGGRAFFAGVLGTLNDSGGVAVSTGVASGGGMTVTAGAATSAQLYGILAAQPYTPGVASFTTIDAHGSETVGAGGTEISATDHGMLTVEGGMVSSGAGVSSFSGLVSAAVVSAGGRLVISSGGVASGGALSSGGIAFVSAGGSAYGLFVASSGNIAVSSGGRANSTTLHGSDAELDVYSGGSASGATAESGGFAFVYGGGHASAITVSNGGQTVLFGGTASGGLVLAGGGETIGAGTDSATTIDAGGSLAVGSDAALGSAGSALGLVVHGGSATVFGSGVISGAVISGGTLNVQPGGTVEGGLDLTGPGEIIVSQGNVFQATVSGLGPGATLDLAGVPYASGDTSTTFDGTTDVVTLHDGGTAFAFTVAAGTPVDVNDINYGDDHDGGTLVTYMCYCAGTRIATPTGEAPVESLRPGNDVRLADGRVLPIRWVARQTVSRRFADPLRALPVRISAGALGGGLPIRDLLLSPGHAVLLHGLLVQASALVNGSTIRRETAMPERFTYWHLELPEHALLLAEGIPAESFLDGVEALPFDNAAERGEWVVTNELAYPRVKSYRQLPSNVRSLLAVLASRRRGVLSAPRDRNDDRAQSGDLAQYGAQDSALWGDGVRLRA